MKTLALDYQGVIDHCLNLMNYGKIPELRRFILCGIDKVRDENIRILFAKIYEIIEINPEHKIRFFNINNLTNMLEKSTMTGELDTKLPILDYSVSWDIFGKMDRKQYVEEFDPVTMIGIIVSTVRNTVIKNSIVYLSVFSYDAEGIDRHVRRLDPKRTKTTIRICNANNYCHGKIFDILTARGYKVELCLGCSTVSLLYLREAKLNYDRIKLKKSVVYNSLDSFRTFTLCSVIKQRGERMEDIIKRLKPKTKLLQCFSNNHYDWHSLFDAKDNDEGLVLFICGPGTSLVKSLSMNMSRIYTATTKIENPFPIECPVTDTVKINSERLYKTTFLCHGMGTWNNNLISAPERKNIERLYCHKIVNDTVGFVIRIKSY